MILPWQLLALVSFSFEVNVTICDSIMTKNLSSSKFKQCHIVHVLIFILLVTIREWMEFKSKRGMSFPHERDLKEKLLPWQDFSMQFTVSSVKVT